MYKLGVYIFLNRVPFPPSLKSCGFKNSMKLGGCQKKIKVTLLERPHEKSCSTSQKREDFKDKIEVWIFSSEFNVKGISYIKLKRISILENMREQGELDKQTS